MGGFEKRLRCRRGREYEHVQRGCGAQQGGEEDEGRWDLHCECLLIVGGTRERLIFEWTVMSW